MDESRYNHLTSSTPITFEDYTQLASLSASYLETSNPELVLLNGIIEETGEVLSSDPRDAHEFPKELGDVMWYVSQIAKYKGFSLEQVANADGGTFTTFRDFQVTHSSIATNSFVPPFEESRPLSDPRDLLAVSILRVIDIVNPKMDELWQGEPRPNLPTGLHEVLKILAQISNAYHIDLDEAVRHTLEKNKNRGRRPHVIDNNAQLFSSGRERLTSDPQVRRLLATSAIYNCSTSPS